jgi:hypothetical protein
MRKYLIVTAIVVALVVAGVLAVVFTAGASTPPVSASSAPLTSADAVLKAAASATENVTSGAGHFRIEITPKADAGATGMLATIANKPIVLTGTVAADAKAKAAEATVTITAANGGISTQAAVRWLGDKGWLEYGGLWYDLPPQLLQKAHQAQAQHEQQSVPNITPADLGIDPHTWLPGLSLVGTETVDGVSAYHVTTGFDVSRIAADAIKIVESPQVQKMLAAHMPAKHMAQMERGLASGKLGDVPAMAAKAVVDPRADVWVDTSSNLLKQVGLSVTLVPPADATCPVTSVTATFTGTVDQLGQPVSVTAPTDVHPWSELQSTLQGQ